MKIYQKNQNSGFSYKHYTLIQHASGAVGYLFCKKML